MNFHVIGSVKSPFIDKFGTPRQSQIAKSSISHLAFNKKIVTPAMLSGFSIGDFIWVVFVFHLNKQKKVISKVHPPRLKGKKMGVLASRSPHRPNPIGLSLGQIVDIGSHYLDVSGLDLVNDTPILDIKPYLHDFDRPKKSRKTSTHWVKENPFTQLKVRFQKNLSVPATDKKLFKQQLGEILKEDPRPRAYFSRTEHQYWLRYDRYDIGFTIKDNVLLINTIREY